MSRASIIAGDGLYGLPVMKFTLTYEGELRANDDWRRKWEIRKQFHPQLQELWRITPALAWVQNTVRYLPKGGFTYVDIHHSQDQARSTPPHSEELIDLLEPMSIRGRQFWPLVRDSLALQCGLKILLLRKENPYQVVYQGGDIDNRLKTLFDALAIPNDSQIMDDPTIDGPIYCLLENDRLIRQFSVDTHRLLSRPNSSKHEVSLVIEVDVRVAQAKTYNQVFLGD